MPMTGRPMPRQGNRAGPRSGPRDSVAPVYETLELERRGAAAIIRLARPQALNAWNTQLGDELLDAVRSVAADDGVRAVCVTGAGRAFSSGSDLRDLTARPLTA